MELNEVLWNGQGVERHAGILSWASDERFAVCADRGKCTSMAAQQMCW